MTDKEILFILGVGRSGTSMLARVLSLCGCALPQSLKDANAANPSGYWEPTEALQLNDAFLFRHGATYFDPTLRLQGEVTFPPAVRAAFIGQIRDFLRRCPDVPRLVIKEPRIVALFEFWLQAAREEGIQVKAIIPIRHPQEVVASLSAWVKSPPELWRALWLKYNLLSEHDSRDLPRVFVEYSSLLSDWRREIARIEHALTVDLSCTDGAAIDAFVSRDLHTQKDAGPVVEPFGYPWLAETYAVLSEAARDQPVEGAVLDRILRMYRACERSFRVALDDSRSKLPAAPPDDGIMSWKP
jgi:hypothetical protein